MSNYEIWRRASWKREFALILKHLSDADYQAKSWFGLLPGEVSSPNELYDQLFSDLHFSTLIDTDKLEYDKRTNQKIKALIDALLAFQVYYNSRYSDDIFFDASRVINDPRWMKLRDLAHECLQEISER